MQPLTDTDAFDSHQASLFPSQSWTPPTTDTFDAFRGVLLATVLGLAWWAGIILVCWRIWG